MTTATTTQKGRHGEDRAVLHLQREGYVILGRNVRAGHDELDVVAKDGDVLCFIEVKRRSSVEKTLIAVGPAKRARIVRCATAYLAQLDGPRPTCRFDVVLVAKDQCTLLRGAFEATARDLGYGAL